MPEPAPAIADEAGHAEMPAVELVADSAPATVPSCLCLLGGEVFAVDIRLAREVMVVEDRTNVPRSPSHVLGVVNLRGRIVPVVDIGPLLGLGSGAAGPGGRALVVEAGAAELAVAVQDVLRLEPVCESPPGKEAVAAAGRFWGRGTMRDGNPVRVLDVPAIVDALRVRWPAPVATHGEAGP